MKKTLILLSFCLITACSVNNEKAYIDRPADAMYRQMYDLYTDATRITMIDKTKQHVIKNGVDDPNGEINSISTIIKDEKNGEKHIECSADFDHFSIFVKDKELYLNILNLGKMKMPLDEKTIDTLSQMPFIPDYDIKHMQNIKKQINDDTATLTFNLSNIHLNNLIVQYLSSDTICLEDIQYTIRQANAVITTDLQGNLQSWKSIIDCDAKYNNEVVTFYQEKEISSSNATESILIYPDDLDSYELINEQGEIFNETIFN